jgi:hypothetical protein
MLWQTVDTKRRSFFKHALKNMNRYNKTKHGFNLSSRFYHKIRETTMSICVAARAAITSSSKKVPQVRPIPMPG